jgi:phospholipid/cholesterol/gamma-HCH transport system permease protein
LVISLPLLTVAGDIFGLIGGGIVARQLYGLDTTVYSSSVRNGIDIDDIIGGIIKPLVFGFIIGLISCHKGLTTTGGTVGVGKSTTNAVVTASICVIIADFFLSKMLQTLFNTTLF